jgi:hypothetical protein
LSNSWELGQLLNSVSFETNSPAAGYPLPIVYVSACDVSITLIITDSTSLAASLARHFPEDLSGFQRSSCALSRLRMASALTTP